MATAIQQIITFPESASADVPQSDQGGKSKTYQRAQLYAALLLGDLMALAAGFLLSWSVQSSARISESAVEVFSVLVPLYVLIAFHRGAFSCAALTSWRASVRSAAGALLLCLVGIVLIGFAWKVSADYSRLYVFGGVAASAVALCVWRYAAKWLVAAVLPDGPFEQIILCADGNMEAPAHWKVLDARARGLRPDVTCPEMMDRLGHALRHVDRVVIRCAPEERRAWTWALKGSGVEIQVYVPELEELGALALSRQENEATAIVARGRLSTFNRLQKRAFDLAIVLWLLPVVALVTAAVALAIKLDDGGPVFFRQKRIGQGNRLFTLYKFRSMRAENSDSDGVRSTARGDSRITRVGTILRSTSIDELPQLINVLRGEMSIVGPRPHAVGSRADDQLFWLVDNRYWLRHAAKPGLTGLAQIRGFRGATATRADLINRVQADLEYLQGWSLAREVGILLSTIRVLVHRNAF